MSDQEQEAKEGAVAIQSGRDTNIGVTPEQMAQILESLRCFVQDTAAQRAQEVAEHRVREFADKVLRDFAKPDGGDPSAFMDPDFQAVVQVAQMGAARSNEETVADTLVALISDRSKQGERSRLALTLNDAIEVASTLTPNEFAELSLIYFVTQTQDDGVGNLESFLRMIRQYILPFVPECSTNDSSYTYLEAKRCVRINNLQKTSVAQFVRGHYGGIFCKGFTSDELDQALEGEHTNIASDQRLMIQCLHERSLLQLRAANKRKAEKLLENHGITGAVKDRLANLFESKFMSAKDATDLVKTHEPRFADFEALWDETAICVCFPTTLGIAIGHSNLRRVSGLAAKLSTWIR